MERGGEGGDASARFNSWLMDGREAERGRARALSFLLCSKNSVSWIGRGTFLP